ncbi:MAG: hypothetical protein ACJ74I_04120 [Gaiellaceae bacterium]
MPLRLAIARTDRVAVAVVGMVAFSIGFTFCLAVRRRVVGGQDDYPRHFHDPSTAKPDALRFGIQFADGRKATSLGRSPSSMPFDESQGPVLAPRGGSGGPLTYDVNMWVWPLPPPGPLAFVCEWTAEGIALTRHETDAASILNAAADSRELWPADGDDGGGASTTVTFGRG